MISRMMSTGGQKSFIYGLRAIMEAMDSGTPIDKILIRKGLKGALFQEFFDQVRTLQVPFQYVPARKLDGITRKNHQGVVAFLSPITFGRIEDLLPGLYESGKTPFLLLLDGLTDVRNFGAILRTAECAGVDGVVIPTRNFARINEDAAKTSAGALYRIPVCRAAKMASAIEYIRQSGVKVVGVTEKTQHYYDQVVFDGPVALVLGSEDAGISPAIMDQLDAKVRIPLAGEIESLNVSVAAGVVAYEVVRQRRAQDQP